jgi:DNA polymerase-3 subunit epsilon
MSCLNTPTSSTHSPTHYAVIDCETTGIGAHDRIVEVAAVLLDGRTLEVIGEFDTLVNPTRDVGPTEIHGIQSSMVSAAPVFSEIAAALSARVHGAVLVGHNLPFDVRFVASECARASVPFDPGAGICTYRLTGERLAHAVARRRIPLEGHHRALADARATAMLFRDIGKRSPYALPASMPMERPSGVARTLRREAVGAPSSTPLARLIAGGYPPSSRDAGIAYFELLDRVLADGDLSAEERSELDAAVARLGLAPAEVRKMHEAYLASIVVAAARDGVISGSERALLVTVARALGLEHSPLPAVTPLPAASGITPGMRICFTGSALGADGRPLARHELEGLAARAGCQPVATVTRRACDLLVAADADTASGKAQKARSYGIPVMAVAAFLSELGASA